MAHDAAVERVRLLDERLHFVQIEGAVARTVTRPSRVGRPVGGPADAGAPPGAAGAVAARGAGRRGALGGGGRRLGGVAGRPGGGAPARAGGGAADPPRVLPEEGSARALPRAF